jgi:hypothetical protein
MHPGMFAWWHARRRGACGGEGAYEGAHGGGCGPRGGSWGDHPDGGHFAAPHGGHGGEHGGGHGGGEDPGGAFGVRRPLRFLAFKLDLSERQVTDLAAILSELKTERAQASVDHRRTTAALADAVAAEAFDEAGARKAAGDRVKSSESVQAAVARALGRIHALLQPEQRAKLAYLLRTGSLSI